MTEIHKIDNTPYMDCKIVMLHTDKGRLWLSNKNELFYGLELVSIKEAKTQHLYVISNEEIKEGEWCIDMKAKSIGQYNSKIFNTFKYDKENIKKIIATTDASLHGSFREDVTSNVYSERYKLPTISKEFIQSYTESYNNGKVIEDVLVEVDQSYSSPIGIIGVDRHLITWVKLKDNTINIKEKEDGWDEIYQLYLKENPPF